MKVQGSILVLLALAAMTTATTYEDNVMAQDRAVKKQIEGMLVTLAETEELACDLGLPDCQVAKEFKKDVEKFKEDLDLVC